MPAALNHQLPTLNHQLPTLKPPTTNPQSFSSTANSQPSSKVGVINDAGSPEDNDDIPIKMAFKAQSFSQAHSKRRGESGPPLTFYPSTLNRKP